MKNRKKVKKIVIAAVAATGVAGGGIAGVTYVRNNSSKAVEVTPVSTLNMGSMASDAMSDGTSGTVVSNVSQSVRIPDGKVIDKVYVKEGDKVKIGDKLLSYDTTLLELDKELQEITVMELGLEIKSAEADLAKLQNAKPGDKILDNLNSNSSDSLLDNPDDNSGDDGEDSSDEEARLVTNSRELLTVQEDGSDTEAAVNVPETESETASSGNSGDSNLQNVESESGKESDVIIDQSESTSGEVLTPDDLNQGGSSDSKDASETDTTETDKEKGKQNQSLEKFFTNVRIKALTDGQEELLADILQGEQTDVTLNGDIKLVPHFRENAADHFQKENTYTMLIYGVKLEQQIEGKVYGTAQIDGADYPEIGGFILAQKSGSEDTAQLTIAFHDGLDQEHEKSPELADMYLEISLKSGEVQKDQVLLRTAGEEKDTVFQITDRTPETESEITSESTEDQSETEEMTISEEKNPSSEEETTESETESEVISGQNVELQNLHFRINWNHENNGKDSWPSSMKAYFYQNGISQQDEPDCTFTLTQGSSAMAGSDTGVDGTDGTIEEEVTTEPITEAASENAQESEEITEDATDITEVIPDADSESSHQTWQDIDLKIPENIKLNSDQLGADKSQWSEKWSAYAPNYVMEVADIQVNEGDASATIVMNMTYTKPADDPLIKLNPISELTWQHGMNTENETGMRAYKGRGTAEDPYVFFVKDGVKITNTFVNWVLGFNEEGTERIGEGYYVRLEIRESDTITGAFIRSIDLDGTILTDHGFGPGTYWIFNSETGITKYEEEVPDDPFDPGGDPGWGNDNDGSTYTAEELAQAIEEKKLEIQKLKLDERQANLKLKNYNKEMEASTVVSAVDGYVKAINGSEDDAYMVVDSENGLYVKTTVSELDLDNVSVDEVINCNSWDSGAMFTATITEIDQFPVSSDDTGYYGASGNVNSSNYPVLAVIDEDTAESLSEYESVNVNYPSATVTDGDAIYLEKAYIRSENGQSYVYIADDNGKLKKQYVRTGGTLWGYYIEVKQGLSADDQIAFPYGKSVKEGAAVKLANEEE